MTTLMVWLLISLPCMVCGSASVPAVTIAMFADVDECQRVGAEIEKRRMFSYLCVQAKVVKP